MEEKMFIPDPEQEKAAILHRYRSLLTMLPPGNPDDKILVRKAFHLAAEAHKTMRRKTGEPYIFHPIEVAKIVAAEIGLDRISVVCALLHDVVEDTEYSLAEIRRIFGEHVARIIDGLTKIEGIFDQASSSLQAENFKKMLLTLSDDVRVILIKLADRLHNMRTLDAMPKHKQLRTASETIYLYAPLAHRLGLYTLKTELEDLALKYTEQEIYQTITEGLRDTEKERKRFISKFILPIKKSLALQNFRFRIVAREKSVYSIWEKMKNKGIPFEEVYDLFAIRIIIDTPYEKEKVDCWSVYSIVTDHYRPNIDRLRDWISMPKANGYEALHTTVMSHSGRWVEIQIRSERMEEIAEKGFAAHWKYKNGDPKGTVTNVDRWLNRLKDLLKNAESNAIEFMEEFQGFLFTDEIFVFTPRGELRNLPVNSTVLDFAYAIHSDLGNKSIGAKVNHKLAPLNQALKSGDQVEIITSQKQAAREEWYGYVVTARAKSQIKTAIKEEKRKFAAPGRQKLENIFRQAGIEVNDNNINKLQNKYNYGSVIDLYYDLALDLIGMKEVRSTFHTLTKAGWFSSIITRPFRGRATEQETLSETIIRQMHLQPSNKADDLDLTKMSYEVSDCCNPVPGDEIAGFIEPNEAIRIHRAKCPVAIALMAKYSNRIIKTTWIDKESVGFPAGIRITGIDRKGFAKEIISVIAENMDLNIKSLHLEANAGMMEAVIKVYVYSTNNLHLLINELKKMPDIKMVTRIEV
ncbi:MAG: bifunctional (p)ppGpp synthetase/guanosine-3',5'-bis(diphosphate) 3'-pyrophosphohydrolase [Bacteroidales bacterium]|nr:bifunctional (p)ppGpp synthetase/guanosine-3',5'-bis(diphosphate) 3'-pyrophosphohydrolase [Bacteroidales bacterium]